MNNYRHCAAEIVREDWVYNYQKPKKSKQQLLFALFYQISFAAAIGRCKLRKYKYRCIKREMQFFLSSVYCASHVYVFTINQLLSNGVGVNNVSGRTWGP